MKSETSVAIKGMEEKVVPQLKHEALGKSAERTHRNGAACREGLASS